MALGKAEQTRKYYLSISEGKIVHSQDGKKEYYSYVEGELDKIYKLERTFKGEKVDYWYIDLRGQKDTYSISLPYKSGVFKSIILALANEPAVGIASIKIEPYKKGDFTKVIVYSNDSRLDWITKELPEVTEVQIAGQTIKDDSKRMAYIESLVADINARLK